jgi:hypothetical protein
VSTLNQSVTTFGSHSLTPHPRPPMSSGLTPDKVSRFTLHQLRARTSYFDSHSPHAQRMMVPVLLKQNTSGSVGQLHCIRASAEFRKNFLRPPTSGAAAEFTGTVRSNGMANCQCVHTYKLCQSKLSMNSVPLEVTVFPQLLFSIRYLTNCIMTSFISCTLRQV